VFFAETMNDVSWQYRIRPTVVHGPWKKEANQGNLTNKFTDTEPNPAQVSATFCGLSVCLAEVFVSLNVLLHTRLYRSYTPPPTHTLSL